ncbi:MAG: NeuD/PglB/VioB family sugar acetyltransferase [Cyanobacteriota bacterium]
MNDIILFPYGGNTKEAISIIEDINNIEKKWNIIGFIDDNINLKDIEYNNYPVLGNKEILQSITSAKILAVPGSHNNYFNRDNVINSLNITKDRYAKIIHPSVNIGTNVIIGYNTLIMPGVVITANNIIGNHCIILPNTVISHDSTIEDYTMIGSNVSISGSVKVKKQSYIGSGSKLIQNITIEEKTLIGLGSVVIRSTEKGDVVAGNPARLLKKIY